MTTTINASASAGLITTADTSTILQLQTNGTAALTVDTSQNVGIGTSSPSTYVGSGGLAVFGTYGTSTTAFSIANNTAPSASNIARIDFRLSNNFQGNERTAAIWSLNPNAGANNGGALVFGTSANGTSTTPTESMRIDSSGYLWIKSTGGTSPWDATSGTYAKFGDLYPIGATAQSNIVAIFNRNTTTGSLVECKYNGSVVGSISVTASNTAYNTSSDYRLKNTIAPMSRALAKVALLKPCTYRWNADGSDGEGFIAHELAEVVPQCVTGEKDAVDADGNPIYQGIDTSFLVATLTAAIQEQQVIITQLQADVAALKGQ
jgi:hypothetical protein